jgi:hypothetical protein
MGAKAFIRTETHKYINWDGKSNLHNETKGHRAFWKQFLVNTPINKDNMDMIKPTNLHNLFSIQVPTEEPNRYDITILVTATKQGNESLGAYSIIDGNNAPTRSIVYTGEASTNQAELLTMQEAIRIMGPTNRQVNVIPKHKSTNKSMSLLSTRSKTTLDIKRKLNELASTTPVIILENNNSVRHRFRAVNALLKRNIKSKTPRAGPAPWAKLDKKQINIHIDATVQRQWDQRWALAPIYRQTKHWFPKRDPEISKIILTYNRPKVCLLVNFLTGHGFLNRHQHLLGNTDSPLCRLCEEEDETPEHLLTECPVLTIHRREIFNSSRGEHGAIEPPFYCWDPQLLLSYFNKIGVLYDLNIE